MKTKKITLDVREDIRNGREPFSKIMSAAAALRSGDQLLLIAPFEPVPLFGVLENQGFQHTAQPAESGDWEVLFTRHAEKTASDVLRRTGNGGGPTWPNVNGRWYARTIRRMDKSGDILLMITRLSLGRGRLVGYHRP